PSERTRKKRARTRLKTGNACSASRRTTLRPNVRWSASRRSRNVSRSEPIKRLSASARSARKRSKRSPNYPAWRTRYALLNLRSGRAKTSTSCATNSRPITFRRISTPSLLSHGTSRLILIELMAQLRRYVVVQHDVAIAITLWILCSWVHEVAVHSPLLIATSAEPDSGKSTLLGVLGFLVPRPYSVVELTGANIYHIVDLKNPTLLIDEADQLFRRKPALAEVVNVGWTRGSARIPRMMHGVMHEFDVFCPKVIGMLGLNLPGTTASRAIVCRLWPKLPSEQVADFRHVDDDNFTALRRKALRWAADSAAALSVRPKTF